LDSVGLVPIGQNHTKAGEAPQGTPSHGGKQQAATPKLPSGARLSVSNPDPKGAKELSTLFHFRLLMQKVKFFNNDQNGSVAAVAVIVFAIAIVMSLSLSLLLLLLLSCKDWLYPQ
jgi:hypothetical protein